jgi:capsule polysaccharide export protein KpsC/LpsZ
MTLKDWKKIERIYPHWINSKTDDRISIIKTLQIREKYYVQYGNYLNQHRKFFMTKAQALKFVKEYMRKH